MELAEIAISSQEKGSLASTKSKNESSVPDIQTEMHKNSLKRIAQALAAVSSFIAVVHIVATIILYLMGYNKGVGDEDNFSVTVVVCAFGALGTCVFALCSCFIHLSKLVEAITNDKNPDNTEKSTSNPVPSLTASWHFHHSCFVEAVGVSLFLFFFLWPGLVIFMLHSLGKSFWKVIDEFTGSTKDTLIAHLSLGVLLFVVDVFTVFYLTVKLKTLLKHDDEDEEDFLLNEKKDIIHPQDVTVVWKVVDKLVGAFLLVVHLAFFVNLIVVAGHVENSGLTTSAVIVGLMFLYWSYRTVLFYRSSEATAFYLSGIRLATIIHLAAAYCFWWITILVFLLVKHFDIGFIDALDNIPSNHKAMIITLIVFFALALVSYGILLVLHQRAMTAIDSLLYFQKTQDSDISQEKEGKDKRLLTTKETSSPRSN